MKQHNDLDEDTLNFINVNGTEKRGDYSDELKLTSPCNAAMHAQAIQ